MERFLPAIREEVQKALRTAQASPEDPQANGKLGMILHAHQQHAAAETCYRRARILQPGEFRWCYYLGVVQAAQGSYSEAAASFHDALAIDSGYLAAQLGSAESLLETGRLDEAIAGYQAAIEAHPKSAAAYYGLGRAESASGNQDAAVQHYRKSVELFPEYGPAHYALALAYRRLDQTDQSRSHFQLAEKHKMTIPPAGDPLIAEIRKWNAGALDLIRTGLDLEAEGRIEEAVQAHLKALEVDPSVAQAHVNLISLYGRLGDVEKAQEHYRATVRINANLADCHYNYGVLLIGQKRLQEAKQALERAIEINPFYAKAHNNLGYLLEAEGKISEAIEHYRQAVESEPDYRLARFHLGRLMVSQRDYKEAVRHLRQTLLPEDEQTPTFLYALAAAYAQLGDRSNALTCLREARQKARSFQQSELLDRITADLSTLERIEGAR